MKKSYWVALAILLAVTLWMISGRFIGQPPPSIEEGERGVNGTKPIRVQVRLVHAREMTEEVMIHGKSAPSRTVTIAAETPGRVAAVEVERGTPVVAGQALVRLAPDDRPTRLAEAEALVKQRALEYEGALSLKRRGLQAERQVAEAFAALESARAALQAIRLDLEKTVLRAPFDGILEDRVVEIGHYVAAGDPVAMVVDLDPFLVTGEVSEFQVGELEVGDEGRARLVDGTEFQGRIRYIARVADEATRTYKVELEVPNPEGRGVAGMTAQAHIPIGSRSAQFVSPALLSLDDGGSLGVKSVDEAGIVRFHPVDILRSEPDGVWLAGLPESLRLITVGQGFVSAGDRVEAVSERAD